MNSFASGRRTSRDVAVRKDLRPDPLWIAGRMVCSGPVRKQEQPQDFHCRKRAWRRDTSSPQAGSRCRFVRRRRASITGLEGSMAGIAGWGSGSCRNLPDPQVPQNEEWQLRLSTESCHSGTPQSAPSSGKRRLRNPSSLRPRGTRAKPLLTRDWGRNRLRSWMDLRRFWAVPRQPVFGWISTGRHRPWIFDSQPCSPDPDSPPSARMTDLPAGGLA